MKLMFVVFTGLLSVGRIAHAQTAVVVQFYVAGFVVAAHGAE